MIHTFSEEYGIFIKASDNILEKEKKNTLVLSVSDNKELLKKYNKEEFHIRHALTVEGVMKYFAKELGYDEELWGIVRITT